MTYIERELGTIDFSSGSTERLRLPREHYYKQLLLRLTGTWTIGTAAATAVSAVNPMEIIQRVEVVANGKDTIKSISGLHLYKMNNFDYGKAGERTADDTTQNATAIIGSLYLDFALPDHKLGVGSLLPSMVLSSLDLKITWGALDGAGFTAGSATITQSSTKVTVISKELLNEDGGALANRLSVNKESTLSQSHTTETGWQTIDLPIGNIYRRIFVVAAEGTAVVGEYPLSSSVFTEFKLEQDGIIVHRSKTFLEAASQDLMDYKSVSAITGCIMVDFDADRDLAQVIDTSKFSTWKFKYNIASACANSLGKVSLILQELISAR